jgi:uncharacterized protein
MMEREMTATNVVQRFYDALGRGDVAAAMALFAPEIAWTEAERFPYHGGTWTRPQQVVDNLFVPLVRDWEDFSVQPRSFVAQGEDVVSFGSYAGTNRRTHRSFTAPFAHHWTVRDGKIAGFIQYTDTAKVLEAVAS